ncbi:peptidase M16 inactive domain-containing protein [Cryptosporidium felis]|nr:peptidase M16 inactive domain-containing protein [Cryptosporidium felis]
MGSKRGLVGFLLVSLLFVERHSGSIATPLVGNPSLNDSGLIEPGISSIMNDSLALDAQYVVGGLNRISEYRAKQSVKRTNQHFDDDEFEKSNKDTNKYSFITLENGMQVFLVSQKSCNFPSASLGVRVGSSMEPQKFPGLAALASEILFFEWKRSEFSQNSPHSLFISGNSGDFRIKVDYFLTEFYFSVKQEYFSEALMRFGATLRSFEPKRIFLDPAMSYLESEFDSQKEFHSNKLKQILRELSAERHVNHGYHMNDMRILRENSGLDEEALLFELVKFYGLFYSSNLMALTVVSEKGLDELQDLVRTFFDDVPNLNKGVITPFDLSGGVSHPYSDLRSKMILVKSPVETPVLTMVFPIPHQVPLWKYKPAEYISFFFTNYSEHSLHGFLSSSELILDLEDMVEVNGNGFSNFILQFKLSSKGEKNILKVIEATLSFLKLIREVPISETVINQIRKKKQVLLEASTSLLYPELSRRITSVFIMNNCQPPEVLQAPSRMGKLDFKHVTEILDFLKHDNFFLILEKKEFKKSASNLLLSSPTFFDGRWQQTRKSVYSFFRGVNEFFHRKKEGVFPKFLTEKYLGGKYILEEIPQKVLGAIQLVNSTLANDFLKIQMPEVDLNFPRSFIIFTEEIPRKEFPVTLYSALKDFKELKGISDLEFSEVLNRTSLVSDLHLPAPFSPRDLDVALSTTKIAPFTKSLCYLPSSSTSDVVILARLKLPEEIPKEYKSPEKLIVLTFLFQSTLYEVLPRNLRESFLFENSYHLWELQEFYYGLEFTWTGFSSVFPEVMDEMASFLINFPKLVKQNNFQAAKVRLMNLVSQLNSEDENLKVLSLSYQLLDPGFVMASRLEEEVSRATLQSLSSFVSFFLRNFAVSGSVFGNATPIQLKYLLSRFIHNVRGLETSENESDFDPDHSEDSNQAYLPPNQNDLPDVKFWVRSDSKNRNLRSTTKKNCGSVSNPKGSRDQQVSKTSANAKAESESGLPNKSKMSNSKNQEYSGQTYNEMSKLPYNYSNSYFYYADPSKKSKLNIVFLQVHYGFFSEQNLGFLQVVAELNSYKHFLEFSENRCPDCSLKILPRAIIGKYLVLEFKLQSLSKNIRELSELLLNFFQAYYSRPSKLISKAEVQKAKEFIFLLSKGELPAENSEGTSVLKNGNFRFEHSELDDLLFQSPFQTGPFRLSHVSCSWRADYLEFLDSLTFEKFFKYWQYFSTSSKLFISYQSQNTNYELLEDLETYLPVGFTRLSSVDSLYDINEQQLTFTT